MIFVVADLGGCGLSSQGWPALARMVLPVAVMGQKSVEKTIEEMHTISKGVPLLHLAVRSQNLNAVCHAFLGIFGTVFLICPKYKARFIMPLLHTLCHALCDVVLLLGAGTQRTVYEAACH